MSARVWSVAALLAACSWLATPAAARQEKSAPEPAPDFERALKSHPYFSKLEFERVADHTPYLFLFQRVPGAGPERTTGFVEKMAPVLDATLEVFEQRIAQPNALVERAGPFVVIVLASKGDLDNYQRVTRAGWHLGVWALHDRGLNACVLYDDVFGAERPWLERVRAARHVFLHAAQVAWCADGDPPLESWIFEGMADALANTGPDAAVLRPDLGSLRQLLGDTQDARHSFAHLRTLAELFTIAEPARLQPFYRTNTPKELQPLDTKDSWSAFYRQASLLFAFLWSDENARHRPALVAFLGDALRGHDGMGEFEARFRPSTVAELEQGFLSWALREHKHAFPLEKLDTEKTLHALARGRATGFEPPPPALDLTDASPEERLALAVFRLAEGREEEGRTTLDALAQEPLEGALHGRVECERRRLRLWCELRDAYLRALVESGGTLSFRVDGKEQKSKLLAYASGELVLEKNRAGRAKLSLHELDALELAQQIRGGGTANDWARLWPYVLREDPRARKLLKDDGGEAGALLKDARDDYPARLRLGRTLAGIEALARSAKPATVAEADERMAELRALREEGGEFDVVRRKGPALLGRAREWLEEKYVLLGPAGVLGAALETLDGGRVRLTYAFDDPRELEDFEAPVYPAVADQGQPALRVPDQPFHLEGGELVADGKATLRTRFDLAPPLSVRYGLAWRESGPAENVTRFFYMGVADDRSQHFVAGVNFRELLVYDSDPAQASSEKFPWYMDTLYAMQMLHDGERVLLRCENLEASIAAGRRKDGAVFLHTYTENPVRISELVIEAKLMPDSLTGLRKARVERELAGD